MDDEFNALKAELAALKPESKELAGGAVARPVGEDVAREC